MRAYWDGERLVSRNGNVIRTPPGFTEGFPDQPLDGELWRGRGTFARLMGALRRTEPQPEQWENIYYMVFDLPRAEGPFDRRLRALRALLKAHPAPHLKPVPQQRVATRSQLMARLDQVVAAGGEGLMLHRGSALPGLPLRRPAQTEALPGRRGAGGGAPAREGRLEGMMGALLVETPAGQHFRLGTGFSDAERRTHRRSAASSPTNSTATPRTACPASPAICARAAGGRLCALSALSVPPGKPGSGWSRASPERA